MSKNKVSEIIESIQARPLMYFGNFSYSCVTNFLNGFHLGCNFSNVNKGFEDAKTKILALRGWQVPSVLINKEMERKGFTEEEMIREILTIEIESWRILEKNRNS